MFSRILVAIDASEYTRQVIPTSLEIARKFSSDVFVLHVAEHDRGRAAVYSTETPAETTRLVADAVRAFRAVGITAGGKVDDVAAGHVARRIVETAEALASDLIVMGSRGLSDVQGLLLGSVAHKVIQLAPVAVLVARAPVEEAVDKAEAAPPAVVAQAI